MTDLPFDVTDPRRRPDIDRRMALAGVGALAFAGLPLAAQSRGATGASGVGQIGPRTTPEGRTPTAILADYAAATTFARLPAAVVDRAKKVIFDEIACAYFGRRTEAGTLAATYAERFGGGPPEARIYGTDKRAPAHYAALANGTAGHGEEVDGTHVIGGHPGASIVHASTAMAARQRASGADLINGVVLAYDVGIRLVEMCGGMFSVRDHYQIHSDLMYALGCASSCCRLLRLGADRHRHAWALATFQANGLVALFAERRHISKSFCNGQYAFAGISATWMAEIGMEGHDDIIGGEGGLLAAWGSEAGRQIVVRALGEEFKILGANFKFYNAGQPIHAPLEAAATLVRQNRIDVGAIRSVVIGMPANPLKTVNDREMPNISVQAMVAASLAAGSLRIIDEPFPAMLDNPVYRRLRPLVSAQVDAELDREAPNGRGARVTITTGDGQRHSLRIDNPRGHSQRGEVSWDDLAEKWTGSLPGMDVGRALDVARRMELLAGVDDLFAAFDGVNRA